MKALNLLFALVFILAFSSTANAASKAWDIYYPSSKLWFEGTQNGKTFTGTFSVYQAAVDFDPKHPEFAKVEVNIDMRSASTGDKERDEALQQKEWFDTGHYPFAQLYGGKITKLAENRYQLTGMLTIKELTHDITMPFSMSDERDASRIKGDITINRQDYGVGTGNWASEAYVKFPVKIGIDLLAKAKE